MIGTNVHVNLHPTGTDLEEKEEDKMRSIFAGDGSHIVYFVMSHMQRGGSKVAHRDLPLPLRRHPLLHQAIQPSKLNRELSFWSLHRCPKLRLPIPDPQLTCILF